MGFGRKTSREKRREEGNACKEAIVFVIPPANYVFKNSATANI